MFLQVGDHPSSPRWLQLSSGCRSMISTLHLALYNNLMEACSRDPCAAFFRLLSVDGHGGISIPFHS